MTLDAWLTQNAIDNSEFAQRIGVTTEAVRRYRLGERRPRNETILAAIDRETNGVITPNSFYAPIVEAARESR